MTTWYAADDITHPVPLLRQVAVVGAGSAIPGTVIGAFYGTLRTQTPVLFAIASGAQWFAIGSTFYGLRTAILSHHGLLNWFNTTRDAPPPQHPPPITDRVRASTVAGAFTGFSLGLLFRGPHNVIPGTIMFSLFGWAGQHGYNYLDARNSAKIQHQAHLRSTGQDKPKEPLLYKIAKSRWSPMSVLSDAEYEQMMQEKLLQFEAQIAIIDDRIQGFKEKAAQTVAQQDTKVPHPPETVKK